MVCSTNNPRNNQTKNKHQKTKEKFTGKERDAETGLDYFGARYYASGIGRWLGVDPMAEKFPNMSPYNYVGNNPVNAFDPDGMTSEFIQESTQWFWSGTGLQLGTVEEQWTASIGGASSDEYFDIKTGQYLGNDSQNKLANTGRIRFIDKDKFNEVSERYGSTTSIEATQELQKVSISYDNTIVSDQILNAILGHYYQRIDEGRQTYFNKVQLMWTPSGTNTTTSPANNQGIIIIRVVGIGSSIYRLMRTLVHERVHALDLIDGRPQYLNHYIPGWTFSSPEQSIKQLL